MKPLYLQFSPTPRASAYLETIWIQESVPTPLAPPTTILPNGRVELIVNYSDDFSQFDGSRFYALPAAHVVGQHHGPVCVRAEGATGMLIARFRPWAAAACFPLPLAELVDQVVALDSIWPRSLVASLLEEVCTARTPAEKVAIVEDFVVTNSECGQLDPASHAAIRTFNAEWGTSRIASLAERLGLSRRQFGRRFIAAVGTTPKKMSRLMRVQKAVICLRNDWEAQDIVASCGYADQSHLIHDVVAHTGVNPSSIRQREDNGLKKHYNSSDVNLICGQAYL